MGQSQNAAVCFQQKGDPFFIEITGSAFFPGTWSQYSHFLCVIMHSANALSSVFFKYGQDRVIKKKSLICTCICLSLVILIGVIITTTLAACS